MNRENRFVSAEEATPWPLSAAQRGAPEHYYRKDLARCPERTAAAQRQCAQRARQGDAAALHQMIESNLRWVVTLSERYRDQGLPQSDLIEEGNLGLIKAARKYDPDEPGSFRRYATRWICEHMERALMVDTRAAPTRPEALEMARIGVESAFARSMTCGHEAASRKSPAKSRRRFLKFQRVLDRAATAVPSPTGENGDASVNGCGVSPDEPMEAVWQEQLPPLVLRWIARLNPLQETIVKGRFGLLGATPQRYKDLALCLRCSPERVRRIEMEALDTLRTIAVQDGLDPATVFSR